jgi:hypothetical protein
MDIPLYSGTMGDAPGLFHRPRSGVQDEIDSRLKMKGCAIGVSVHTGWAACVAAGGSLRAPRIEAREELEMLGDADRFVFHRAAEMDPAEAKQYVARAEAEATEHATAAIARIRDGLRAAGHDILACAIVAKDAPMLASLAEIVAAHPRIHTAEGRFYRDVLRRAADANRLKVRIVSPKVLGLAAAAALLADAGRQVGKPWGKDQKMAALAAWSLL